MTNDAVTWDVLEARCGTTTQRDFLPAGWSAGKKQLAPNTALVHRLFRLNDGRVEWKTDLYIRSVRGFRRKGPLPLQGGISGQGVIVWPRVQCRP